MLESNTSSTNANYNKLNAVSVIVASLFLLSSPKLSFDFTDRQFSTLLHAYCSVYKW